MKKKVAWVVSFGQSGGMAFPRLLVPEDETGLYHVVSRVVDRRLVFGEREKRHFLKLAKGYARFSGIRLLGWAVMGNHFHLLVEVAPPSHEQQPGEVEILRRLQGIYSPLKMREVRDDLVRIGTGPAREEYLDQFRRRMNDLGLFMKTLKQRFSQWFNRVHDRRGTLWEGRYHSTVIERETGPGGGLGQAARVVAAYLDLNPVRAGMVEDPADAEWTTYGAAVRGSSLARRGLEAVWGRGHREGRALDRHRMLLFDLGTAPKRGPGGEIVSSGVIDAGRAWRERQRGGRLPLGQILRLRLRHLTQGGILGTRDYVARVTDHRRVKATPCPLRHADWGGLHAMRQLRVRAITVPAQAGGK